MLKTADADALRLAYMATERQRKLGSRVRERREELGLTQRDVADRIGGSVDGNQVSRWERGAVYPEVYIEQLADALETSEADLVAGPLNERKSQGDTPDLAKRGSMSAEDVQTINERLDKLEAMMASVIELLTPEAEVLPPLPEALRPSSTDPPRKTPRPARSAKKKAAARRSSP